MNNISIPSTVDRLVSLEDVAGQLGGVSTRTVRRLIAKGDLPKTVKVMNSPRLYQSDVLQYLENLKQKRERNNK